MRVLDWAPAEDDDQQQTQPIKDEDKMEEFQNSIDKCFASINNPIQFWIEQQYRQPHASWMALDIFGIPPTEADNEHLYSIAGDMVMKKRYGLSTNIIGAVQCL